MGEATYVLRFFCEWGGGCLWPGNDAAYRDFDLGPYDLRNPCPLPLSAEMLRRCRELDDWHSKSLNHDYSLDPGPWRQPECDHFNNAVADFLTVLRKQLGRKFKVINRQGVMAEDLDLDAYLSDPKGFRRKS